MKLAVLISGELREWHRVARYMFEYFDEQTDDVDYYFATWDTSVDILIRDGKIEKIKKPITIDDIRKPFDIYNQRLINTTIHTQFITEVRTFYHQSWLGKQANILKRQHESANNFIYDQVVEVRPDIYLRSHELPWVLCEDHQYVPGPRPNFKSHLGVYTQPDLYTRTNSWTNDIVANRMLEKTQNRWQCHMSAGVYANNHSFGNFDDNEQLLSDFLFKRKIYHIDSPDFCLASIVRPHWPDELDTITFEDTHIFDAQWNKAWDNTPY